MNVNAPDAELDDLIQRPARPFLPWTVNNGRVNPVQQRLQREQPQINPFIRNNWTPNMPSNGGYKKKRTSKNSKKYKNKNYKNKNRKRQQTKRVSKMK